MTAIPPPYRTPALSDPEITQLVLFYGLAPCYKTGDGAHARLFILIPGVTQDKEFRRSDMNFVPIEEWLRLLHSERTIRGVPSLKVVGDTRDPRHLGVAWNEAGRADNRSWRKFGDRPSRERRRKSGRIEDRLQGRGARGKRASR